MDDTSGRLITSADFDAVDSVDARTRKALVDAGIDVSAIDPMASMQAIDNPELHVVAGQVRKPLKMAVEAI